MENYALGAIKSDVDVRNYRLTNEAVHNQVFPEEFALTMPKVKNQGQVGSCVAHAMSTIIEYFNLHQVQDTEPMSAGFIYGNRQNTLKQTCGMMLHSALDNARHDGNVKQTDFPHNVEMPKAKELFEQYYPALQDKAEPYRITGYYYCPNKDAIKAALMRDGPVMIALTWRSDIHLKEDGYTLDTAQKLFDIKGGHCMVIYGWNKDGWLVQNSWGENWGRKGTCLIPYRIRLFEAWGVIDTNTDNRSDIKKPFSSKIGRVIAKILNAIVNAIVNLFKKKQ